MYDFIFDQKFVLRSKSHKLILRYFVIIDFIWCFFLFGLCKMYHFKPHMHQTLSEDRKGGRFSESYCLQFNTVVVIQM